MKITISVGGRFHAFNLAEQLFKKGVLERLITSYPRFETKKYGLPATKISSIVTKEILARGWQKTPWRSLFNPDFFINSLYDRLASPKIVPSDIFVGFASFSRHSMIRAKQLGAITLLETGGSHVLFNNNILEEEYGILGSENGLARFHPKTTSRELREYEEADYIVVPSSFAKQTFRNFGFSEKKLIQVPYGVNLSEFKTLPKTDRTFRVMYVGGMSLGKGVHYLLQAFSELNLPNSELLLIGSIDDDIKPFFRKYEGKYKYFGHVPQRELYKYYSQGSAFVLNSLSDGFGMVILQAMACGLPVICTTNTGGPDVITEGKDGFIIAIRDLEALKERLLFFYENQEICLDMGKSARRRVAEEFTWDDYGDKVVRAYGKIMSRNQ